MKYNRRTVAKRLQKVLPQVRIDGNNVEIKVKSQQTKIDLKSLQRPSIKRHRNISYK